MPKGVSPACPKGSNSRAFSTILTELYNRGYIAVNIHDEIVLLDTPKDKQCTVEEVTEIIEAVYLQQGLHPTCKVQRYSPEYVRKYVEEKIDEYRKISAKYAEITQQAKNGDTVAQDILQHISQGNLELCYSDDKTEIIIHNRH